MVAQSAHWELRRFTSAHLNRLAQDREGVMMAIYQLLACQRDLGAWEQLSGNQQAEIVGAANDLCERWDRDERIRADHCPGHSLLGDLLALQYEIGRQIAAAEGFLISAVARGKSSTLH